MTPGLLLIRADASVATGTGHVMRCLALAQAWEDIGGRVLFAMAEGTPSTEERLLAESCPVLRITAMPGSEADSQQTRELARQHHADWVIVDGYQFGDEYQRALKSEGLRVALLDDYGHAEHYSADVVINQNVSASKKLYENRELYTRFLLGPRYCTLRREFRRWQHWNREISAAGTKVLVTMGGSDPENVTSLAIQALESVDVPGLEATVVVGGSNPASEVLEEQASRSRKNLSVCRDVSDIAERMAWADVAVAAAGSTCWELCLLGLPAIVIDVASNQSEVAAKLDRLGCAIHLGTAGEISAEKIAGKVDELLRSLELRRSLSWRSRELVDGAGAERVISILRGGDLQLRRAVERDCRLLWEWANDPEVRAASFSSAPIPWEIHVRWYTERLRGEWCFMFIAENSAGETMGQIRFDRREDGEFNVGVSVAKASRGRGMAVSLIQAGIKAMFTQAGCARIHALVRPSNTASLRTFESAGFQNIGDEKIGGAAAVHLLYKQK
jgi:UDP-2,4-diacetamido-2,4,6-trideoxy-beta-L-altropyranose hydrolase